jgi:hypothetical protein
MKSNKITFSIFLWLLMLPFFLVAQDVRLEKTKVADLLALLPATDNQQADRLFHELLNLSDEGLTMVTAQVRPNGNADGVTARYAVSLLTHYATKKEEKARIEQHYLNALSKAKENEVKAYFINNIKLIGSNACVKPLTEYLKGDKELADQVIGAFVTINTNESKEAMMSSLSASNPATQERLIKAMGELHYQSAVGAISKFVSGDNAQLKKQSLWSLALLADAGSADVLLQHAKATGFKNDPSEATQALVEYLNQVKGNVALVTKISNAILANTPDSLQQHFRLAALESMSRANPEEGTKLLVKERNHFDAEYRKEILKIASPVATSVSILKLWEKEYKNSKDEEQAEILAMLSKANRSEAFIQASLIPALSSSNAALRIAAAQEIANSGNKKFAASLIDYILKLSDDAELQSAKAAALQLIDQSNTELVSQRLDAAPSKNKIILLQILSDRRATKHFSDVVKLTSSTDEAVRSAALNALTNVSSGSNTAALLQMLIASQTDAETKALQAAAIASLDKNSSSLIMLAYPKLKIKLLPILPYVNDATALDKVIADFYHGNEKEKEVAFSALANWQTSDALRPLLSIRKNSQESSYHAKTFKAFISQLTKSTLPDDQKLLMLRDMMTVVSDKDEKMAVIRAAGNVRTFLSLVFVSAYLDDTDLGSAASRAVMQIALPTADAKPGLTGVEVRNALQKVLDKLSGEDSQYEKIDVATYMEKLPFTKGYESIFNGKDLSGWQGLVENPIARSKMSKEVLAKKQKEADAKIKDSWSVKDGTISFTGEGANLCTIKPYGDFEMLVDWKISRNGDSGIYLRGSPQVQIWDTSRVQSGAQVGSGGLYNNKTNRSTPLVVADNPIGEWNTFRITMVGDRVTVYLNGILVVDNVVMENYWDYNLPIFSEEAIELQAHGTALAFRNLYIKELSSKPYELSKEEKEQGFQLLFNGKDLDNWQGNKTDYVVEENTIAIYPTKEGHGNLNTNKEYSDFIFRFEFQLTPGANNGLAIHAPLDGDAAYVGKEIQILDNTAPVYAKLEPYQYHGSVYGVIAAKRDFLKPVGEWNQEEVYVKGNYIKVTLNGTVITEGDMKKVSKNGTLDHKEHPGLDRNKGYLGFLGHGSVVKFKNIRIKDLAK